MALIAAHLAKVSLEHTTHSAVVAHVGKEAVRQTARRGRRSTLKATHSPKSSNVRSSKGFNPRAPKVSSGKGARSFSRTSMSYAARGYGGHGGGGFASGFASGGFHGK